MTRWTAPWWRTLVLALLLFGGLASAIAVRGPETVTLPAPDVAWPESLTFAAPRLGDHARYEVVWTNATTGNVTGEEEFAFALPETVTLPGPDALPRDYVVLRTEGDLGGMDGLRGAWKGLHADFEAVDPATGLVAVRFLEGRSNDGMPGCDGGGCPEHRTSYKRQVRHHAPDDAGRTPCTVFHHLQGRTMAPGGWNGTLLAPCSWYRADPPTFAVAGLGVDNETLLLVHEGNGTRLEVWLHPDVPYPVRHALHRDRLDAVRTVTLTGFHRGEEPLPVPGGPLALPLVPATATGPDDARVEHPYPLSRAWLDARGDDRVAEWLRTHPDAYLRMAYHGAREDRDGNTTTWWTAWSDGDDSVWVNVTFRFRPAPPDEPGPAPVDPLGILGGEDDEQEPTRNLTEVEVEVAPRDAAGDPRPAQAPRALPSVATLWQRWQASTDGTAPPNDWGYEVYCVADCDDVRVALRAGHILTYRREGEAGRVEDAYRATLGSDGTVVGARFDRDVTAIHEAFEPRGGAVESVAAPAEARPASAPATVTVEVWRWPDPVVTTTLSGLALLLVLLHHFSPGLVRLFSRVRHADALDHPVRRLLLDAVAAEPGIHARALARRTGHPRGTVTHHLRKLEETGHLRSRTDAGLRCYVPAAGVDRRVAAASPLLHRSGPRAILLLLADGPVDGVSALARVVGLSPSTCHHHVGRLERAGLVAATRGRGRRGTITLTDEGAAVLARLGRGSAGH